RSKPQRSTGACSHLRGIGRRRSEIPARVRPQTWLMLLAAAFAGGELVEQGVAVALDLDVGRAARVERVQAGALPDDVRRDAGADHGDAVLLADPGTARAGGARRMRIGRDLERIEPVAEGAVRLVH